MQIRSLSTPLSASGGDCLTIFVDSDGQIIGAGAEINDSQAGKLAETANSGLLGKEEGSQLLLPLESNDSKSALLYRLGKHPISDEKYPAAIQRLASTLLSTKLRSIAADVAPIEAAGKSADQILGDLCLDLMHLSYRF